MPNFVHLHNHSDYSLLDGAASVSSLVGRAKSLDMSHLAITDHGNLFGAINFYKACKSEKINPIIGCEFYLAPGSRHVKRGTEGRNRYHHFLALARNLTGYQNLLQLSSLAYTEGFYYKPRIDDELLEKHADGLIATSACLNGEVAARVLEGRDDEARAKALHYESIFGKGNFYLELQDHGIPDQKKLNKALVEMSKSTGIPLVATNDVHYTNRADANAQDILLCIGTNKKRSATDRLRFNAAEYYMKTEQEMLEAFSEVPEAIKNTLNIAERCNLEIPLPGPELPNYVIPDRFDSPEEYLRHLTTEGLKERYGNITEEIRKRADYELDVIISMGFTGYFLIVWDFVHFALEREIPVGPGRGSGPASIVGFALHITDVDPIRYGLVFERFLNPERVSMPDFDIDFCYERRQEVIDYVTAKYGKERVAQIITFGRLKARAVLRDVARVLDLPYAEADSIAKLVPAGPKTTLDEALNTEPRLKELYERGGVYKELIETGKTIEGLNRHASTHAAGVVIGKKPLSEYVPLYRDPKTGSVSTQFTYELLEECGLVKIDVLGLDNLTIIKNCEALIRQRMPDFSIAEIHEDDKSTFKMLCEGRSTCVFQFGSSGMQGILKRTKPEKIDDLIALNALYRPGPMEHIDEFISAKNGHTPIRYPLPQLEPVLKETYGVIVFQEQVLKIAQLVGGYSLGQADILRRAMGKKKPEVMAKEKKSFILGATEQGFSKKEAEGIFDLLVPFAGYGFNKTHSAAYAIIAYRTAYLKANFSAEFMAANLTSAINAPDKITEYIAESKEMGLEIVAPDVNLSEMPFSVVDGQIVYGLLGIKNVGTAAVEEILTARTNHGNFISLVDFLEKVDLKIVNRKVVETLILAGLFDSMETGRATLLHNLDRITEFVNKKKEYMNIGQSSLFDVSTEEEIDRLELENIEEWTLLERLRQEKAIMGFYFSGHPLEMFRATWQRSVTLDLAQIQEATPDHVYNILVIVKSVREIQTRKGSRMAFVQVEDFSGSVELVVFPDQWDRYRELIVPDAILGFQGRIDFSRGEPKIKTEKVLKPEEMPGARMPGARQQDSAQSEASLTGIAHSTGPGVRQLPGSRAVTEASSFEGTDRSISTSPPALHIRLNPLLCNEDELNSLLDFLNHRPGRCSIYLHTATEQSQREAIIKASPQLGVAAAAQLISEIESLPTVEAVWQE